MLFILPVCVLGGREGIGTCATASAGGGAEAIAGGVGVEAFSGPRGDAAGGGCDNWHVAGKAGCWPAFGSTGSGVACELLAACLLCAASSS